MKKVRVVNEYLYTLHDVQAIAISLFNKMGLGALGLHTRAQSASFLQTPEQFMLIEDLTT